MEQSPAALQASAAALSAGEDAIAKIALLRAQLPAIPPRSSQLLKYFFDPLKHPRWPAGDPEHHGGEFRPVGAGDAETAGPAGGHQHDDVPLLVATKDDDEVPPLGGQRRPKDEEVEPARVLPHAPRANPPPVTAAPEALGVEGAAAEAGAAEAGAVDAEGAAAEEASLPLSEQALRAQVRAELNAFASDHPELAQNLAEARRRFEAQYDVPDLIRRSPEYQSYWQMPPSYEAARVSPYHYQFDSMQKFESQFGRAPPGWDYHHIVNQNPLNQGNPDVNWRLHTTENVVLLPRWRHWIVNGIYSSKTDEGILVRVWQAAKSYREQLDWGINKIWKKQ